MAADASRGIRIRRRVAYLRKEMNAALHPRSSNAGRRGRLRAGARASFIIFVMVISAGLNVEPGSPVRIVAFGDSLTAGYGLRPREAFPVVLGARLRADGYNVTVVNAGVSGETTQAGLTRLPSVLALHPGLLILEFGCNDMLNGLDPKLAESHLEKMIAELRSKGVPVLLAGMRAKPGTLGDADKQRFDALFPALAARHALPFYPYFLQDVLGNPELVLWGGVHPNPKGVRRIVDGVAPIVERMLDAGSPSG